MSETQDIRRALQKRLLTVSGITEALCAFENKEFEPNRANPGLWYKVTFLPTSQKGASAGINAMYLHMGVFVISIYAPIGKGPATAEEKADAIRAAFPRGQVLSENSKTVRIEYSERAGAFTDENWYVIPVTVSWYCYI